MNDPSRPLIIPFFIAHEGCPHRCLFCNQHPITGFGPEPAHATEQEVAAEIETWLRRSPRNGRRVQVAFYGGSFTGLPRERQQQLLGAVQPFIRRGQVDGIRVSTRPDYVHPETPAWLQGFGVETVELGVQSLDQGVLDQSLRGHSVRQAEEAIALLKGAGLLTGAQLMVGLPGESTTSAVAGARRLVALGPHFARLYPALVIRGSGLETLYRQGAYRPLPLLKAIALTARLAAILAQGGVRVIRIGLQPSAALEASLVAGPYHPALGELVKARGFFNEIRRQLTPYRGQASRLTIAARDRSLLSGPRQCTLRRLQALGLLEQTAISLDDSGRRGEVRVVNDRL